jgi:DNA-binding NtrC family response regulator
VDKIEYRPVGANGYQRADFRIICATNRDLAREVEEGRFLKDLYYRLKVVRLTLPPLRERREDIPLLAEHFLTKYARKFGRRGLRLSSEALDLLGSYSWPGNVRDLEHEVERAVAFSSDGEELSPDSFSEELRSWGSLLHLSESGPLAQAVEQVERQMIREALKRAAGNRSQAARLLGLSRRGLLNKIERYGLKDAQV